MKYGVGHGGLCIKMMKGSLAHRGANEIGLSLESWGFLSAELGLARLSLPRRPRKR